MFEKFISRVFEAYGCAAPSHKTVNVSANGYELDIATTIKITGDRAIAECKAYSSNVRVEELSKFYGKVATERLDGGIVHGWFVALPGLTSDGYQLARRIQAGDSQFRLFDADEIFRLLTENSWINPQPPDWPHSDLAVVLTDHGLFLAAKRLEPTTRLPICAHVWSTDSEKPSDVVRDLLADSDYSVDLDVIVGLGSAGKEAAVPHVDPTEQLVRVSGSTGDFEYQYPASPKFFIGRSDLVGEVQILLGRVSGGSVVVLNAQSGWGKSSLALKLSGMVEKTGGIGLVLDARTASSPSYVWAALHKLAEAASERGVLKLPAEASFGSLRSCLETLCTSLPARAVPLLLFFDQFENVFRDTRLTQEFRDLALAVRDVPLPIVIGFAWKTDLVGWTEKYPYQLRDEIRGAAQVFQIHPFGPAELGIILSRLAKAAGMTLSNDLRQRLREYSQGLPWLIKKLAGHVLRELAAGRSGEDLVADSLSIQRLFEQDLAGLTPQEESALRSVAKDAPVQVSEVLERVAHEVIQSLVDQRLLVRVGERLDTYWDTFRDFLVLGRVNVADTYILRQNPVSTSRLMQLVIARPSGISGSAAAQTLRTSVNSVFNCARDLRQLGVLGSRDGVYMLGAGLVGSNVDEQDLRDRVAVALRRHRLYQVVAEHTKKAGRPFAIPDVADELKRMFPAVRAEQKTWISYARAFARWFSYANLYELRGQELHPPGKPTPISLLLGSGGGRQKTFPQGRPATPLILLEELCGFTNRRPPRLSKSSHDKATNDLLVLGLVDGGRPSVAGRTLFTKTGVFRPSSLARVLANHTATADGFNALKKHPGLSPAEVGEALRRSQGTTWATTTAAHAGRIFRAWAKAAGVPLERPSRQGTRPPKRTQPHVKKTRKKRERTPPSGGQRRK